MTLVQILFYLFSAVAVGSSLMVVASRNPVRGALFLVLTFVAMAGLWMLLQAEFLSLVLVLVYVGAVMTLFLFVVMMLNINQLKERKSVVRYFPLAAMVVMLVVAFTFKAVGPDRFGLEKMPAPTLAAADYSNTASLGNLLYTNYVYPFEVAAVLLLTAIIAAISLSHRPNRQRKTQVVSEQIAVRREDRIRLVNMAAEKKPGKGTV